jgi:hypothetical protein
MADMQDLITYIFSKFTEKKNDELVEANEKNPERLEELKFELKFELGALQPFLKFARELLNTNPPTSIYMATKGIGLKLADATEVPILAQPDLTASMGGDQYWMPITNPKRMGPDMQSSQSMPITGGR